MTIPNIEATTTALLGLALDAASLRQQAIAANIANANSAGFEPIDVSFEAQLEDARAALAGGGRVEASALEGVAPCLELRREGGVAGLPSQVMLDLEVARLAENAVRYQALAKGLSRHFAVMSAAVSDGKK